MKTQNNFSYSIVLISLLIFNFGCTKSDQIIKPNNITSLNQKTLRVNIYDVVGQFHNAMLDQFIDNHQDVFIDGVDMESFKNAFQTEVINSSETVWENLDVSMSYSELEEIADYTVTLGFDSTNVQAAINEYISSTQELYLDSIFSILHNPLNTDSSDIFENINNIEASIMGNANMSELEIVQLLITASVAKYSWLYWNYQFSLGDSNPWKTIFPSKGKLKKNSPSNNILDTDVEGAIAGALTGGYFGGTAGTVVMPVAGTVTGVVSGAVIGGAWGAVGSSAVHAVFELVFWWNS